MSTTVVSVAIAYHSGYGHTTRMAESVEEGVRSVAGATAGTVRLDDLTEEDWARLDAADAIVFGSPTYMGSASPVFHAFAAASSERWYGQRWKDKVAAGFTTSGSPSGDKLNTLQYFTVFAAQHGMHWVNLDLLPGDTENDPNRLGGWLGAMGRCPVDQGPESMPKGDLLTAAHLGRRVAGHARLLRTARTLATA
ncbi:FMN reductase [Streptomyces fumigatiscleroticus]|nr:FMN reductase [Streptomyces fumigatiscleroticus]